MNFLGHCLLTQYNPEYISGNLAGDHFKGDLSKFKDVLERIIKGVEIHRFIDSFTDDHEAIKTVAKIYRNYGVNRVSFIASDIILDHFISKNWQLYSNTNLTQFINSIYKNTKQDLIYFSDEFSYMFSYMSEHDWLSNYIHLEGINQTLINFEKRIPFTNNLSDSYSIYTENTVQIDELYKGFMLDIIPAVAEKFNLNLN